MNWIKISDRMPSEEEAEKDNFIWWHPGRETFFDGDFCGTYINLGEWQIPIEDLSHWAIVEGPTNG